MMVFCLFVCDKAIEQEEMMRSRDHQTAQNCRCHKCEAAETIKPISLYRGQQAYKTADPYS